MKNTRKIILIGGAPTTGKSTVAALLARHFSLPWISTDQVREVAQIFGNRKDLPKLFTPEGYTAEKFLNEFSAEQIVRMELDQAETIWPAVKKLISDDYNWKSGVIIEGVGILPYLVARDFRDSKDIITVFLVDEDADSIRNTVFVRGLWDSANTYPDDVKEKEVEWALLFGQKLREEAKKYNYPVIEVKKDEDDLKNFLEIIE